MKNKIAVIGSGFASLSAACYLAKNRCDVSIYEKNDTNGGRARQFKADGFTFDMGPSWYWMPDVFDRFFSSFGYKTEDFYSISRLDPSYKVFFENNETLNIPANTDKLFELFDKLEKGSGSKLKIYLEEAKFKYNIGINNLVLKPGKSITEFFDKNLFYGLIHLHVFKSISTYIRKFFKNKHIIQLLEFPVLFLGAKPQNTPALYSLMNYADISLGTWYPQKGMYSIVESMVKVAQSLGVKFNNSQNVEKISVNNRLADGIVANGKFVDCDYIVGGADYHHIEKKLLEKQYRNYDEKYWNKRTMAPSSLIFYLGINKEVNGLNHHNLFFDTSFEDHAKEIYDEPKWPTDPLFYVCCPSKTDKECAPKGMENMFILIPVAPDLEDNQMIREKYFKKIINRLEKSIKQTIKQNIIFKKSYAHKDFINDYNSFKGNAYGLANTLKQTAIFKPSINNKKIKNLFYTGQLTVPGPGVPPSIISGEVTANEILKQIKKNE